MKVPSLLKGAWGLCTSRSGTLTLLWLGVSSYLNYHGTLDGVGYAAVSSVIVTVYTYTRARPIPEHANGS